MMKVTLTFGSDEPALTKTYEFATENERRAFLTGLEHGAGYSAIGVEMDGYEKFDVLDTCFTPDQYPYHKLNWAHDLVIRPADPIMAIAD